MAFSAPALANSPAPAPGDQVTQTGTVTDSRKVVTIEPVIEIEPVADTETPDSQPTPLIQATPFITPSEVAGEVITSETYVPPAPETAEPLELEHGSAELGHNLDGFNQDNSQFDVDGARTTITFGAKR